VPATLLSLATAVPPFKISQAGARQAVRARFERTSPLFDRLSGVFDNAGIANRHTAAPPEWYGSEHGLAERNRMYLATAKMLFSIAAAKAIRKARLRPSDIDGIVTVSTTGIATPSIEARTFEQLELRSDVRRVPVFGLGCAGGVSGLAIAAQLAQAAPGTRWLMVAVEICSASASLDPDDPAAIVGSALFADGAAAAVVEAGEKGPVLLGPSAEVLWPDTRDIMGWRVGDDGLQVVFDRSIPPFVEQHLKGAIATLSQRMNIDLESVQRLCCHPGGAKVVAAIERSMALQPGSLDVERQVLENYGNMSSPTILFVLKKLIDRGLPRRVLMTALGPGFTCAGLVVDRARARRS
jgi:alkylresorcinol/alkylpyrone synthase